MKPHEDLIRDLQCHAQHLLDGVGLKVLEWDSRPLFQSWKTLVLGALSVEGRIVIQKKNMPRKSLKSRISNLEEAKLLLESVTGIEVPSVLAYDLDRRIVIMTCAPGETLTKTLLKKSQRGGVFPACSWMFESCAGALAAFHHSTPSETTGHVRLYGDFGPQNILVDEANRLLTLIDLPSKWSSGMPEQDLGHASLEWLRLGLRRPTLRFLIDLSRGRLRFLACYSAAFEGSAFSLLHVHREEQIRLTHLFKVAWKFARCRYGWRNSYRFFIIAPALGVLKFVLVPLQHSLERRLERRTGVHFKSQKWR